MENAKFEKLKWDILSNFQTMCVASLAIFRLQNVSESKKCYFTIHCEEEEVLCLISCRRSEVGGGGAWFKERQFWQKYVHKGKKSFWCLATCHSKVGLKSSALHREKKTSQKVSTIFPFWNTSPKLRFLHWNSYLTKCKCRPTDTRIFLLYETDKI